MKALVLSGGGAKGAYEAGLTTTLIAEFGEQFDIICGTSIGAINAAFLAQDDGAALADLWHSIAAARIVSPVPRVNALIEIFHRVCSIYQAPLAETNVKHASAALAPWHRFVAMIKMFLDLPAFIRRIEELHPVTALAALTGAIDPVHTQNLLSGKLALAKVKRTLITTATDLATATADVFCHFPAPYAQLRDSFIKNEPCAQPYSAAQFAETIRASGAIPAAFSPVALQCGSNLGAYVDGGVINNTPVGQAVDAGADEVTLIYLDPPAAKGAPIAPCTSIPEILLSCFGIMQQRILELDYQTALRVNDAVGAQANDTKEKRIIRLRTFRPQTALAVGVLDFDKHNLVDAAFAQGQADARTAPLRTNWQS